MCVHAQSRAAVDSAAAARKKVAADAAAVRKYKSSKKYTDSVAKAKKNKAKLQQAAREARLDSIKQARTGGGRTDSTGNVVMTHADSIKAQQKERIDKAAALRKYKASKRYADSVTISKRTRGDEIKLKQQKFRDSISAVRKHSLDSAGAIRKHFADSSKMARTKVLDSIKLVRKKRTDSLAKAKINKEKVLKAKDKTATAKKALALEIKMKQKREAFTNKTMLKKKWSPMRKLTQNSFTHYNYYYNANRKMEEATANMLRGGIKENYDTLIGLYPFDPNKDSALLSSDMDSIIRKVSVGIQIHDPRVKWANDLYLLMGQAYYYKGNYANAATTFRYIIASDEEAKKKNGIRSSSIVEGEGGKLDFLKHKSVHNDAILWLARVYTSGGWVENSQAVISLLATDPKLPNDLKGRVAEGRAFSYLAEQNESAASDQLEIVIEDNNLPDWLRMRAAFLNGQLKQRQEKYKEAVVNFTRCLDFFPKIEMDFFARKNIAYNTLLAGGELGDGIKPLKKVLNDGKYVSYYDQVYYVLGKLSAKAGKPNDAVNYLTRSATTPKATKKQKAISYAALGDVQYTLGNYMMAKNAYDSAAKFGGSSSKDEAIAAAVQRSKGLQEVSQPLAVIREQDSLLELAALTAKEQQSVVRRYLKDLEKKLADSIAQAAEDAEGKEATSTATTTDVNDGAAATGNWYFNNPTQMQQGAAEFKRKWGNRTLTDNWRRGTSAMMSGAQNGQGGQMQVTEEEEPAAVAVSGLPSEESLLSKIPNTQAQKDAATRQLQKAYIFLAKAYMRQLGDGAKAVQTLDTMNIRFPGHSYKEEELYIRYQAALQSNNLAKAQEYAQELLAKYPTSQYAAQLKPKGDESKGNAGNKGVPVAAYYKETYDLIINHQYTEALMHINVAKKDYDDAVFKKRFALAEAMAYAGQGNYDMADTLLAGFNKTYTTNDSLTAMAADVSAYVKDVRKNGKPSWWSDKPFPEVYKVVPVVEEKKAEPAKPVKPPPPPRDPDAPYVYAYKPEQEHVGMLILRSVDSRTGRLKQAIREYNSTKGISDANAVIIDMYSTKDVVMLIKQLGNAEQATTYMDSLATIDIFKEYVEKELIPVVISAKNYKKMFVDQESDPYINFYKEYYRK